MRARCFLVISAISLLIPLATAQTKISGTCLCAKPDTEQKIEVPDHPDHTLSISQAKCTWTKPMEVAGIKDKEGVTTASDDIHGDSATGHGYFVDTMANGDHAYVHFQGSASIKDGTSHGTWSYAGGTGKFTGLKGKGTYKGKAAQDGNVTYEVVGEYELGK